jgi:hypothetical protein
LDGEAEIFFLGVGVNLSPTIVIAAADGYASP